MVQTKSEQLFESGKTKYKLNDYDNAIKDLELSIKQDLKNSLPLKYIAFCHYQLGDFESAYKSFHKYNKNVKDDIESINDSGCCNLALGKYEKAITYFDKIIKLKPQEKYGYLNKATAFYNQEKWKEALPEFETVLSIDSKDENSLMYASFCNHKLGNQTKADILLNTLLNEYPHNFTGYYLSIVYCLEAEDKEKALNQLEKLNNMISSTPKTEEIQSLLVELKGIISQIENTK